MKRRREVAEGNKVDKEKEKEEKEEWSNGLGILATCKSSPITFSLMVKCADVRSTGSITTITLGSTAGLTRFIHTDTGNSRPYEVIASI